MNFKFNINGKMLTYVLGTALLIYLSTVGLIAFKLKNNSAANAMASYETIAINESKNIENAFSHYTDWMHNTAIALSLINEIDDTLRRDYAKKLLDQFLTNDSIALNIALLWDDQNSIDNKDSLYTIIKGNTASGSFSPLFRNIQQVIQLSEETAESILFGDVETLKSKDLTAEVFAISNTNNTSIIQLTLPITSNGQYKGMLIAQLNMSSFLEKENIKSFDNFIISDQEIVATTNISLDSIVLWNNLAPKFNQKYPINELSSLGKTFSETIALDYNNRTSYCIFVPIKLEEKNWIVTMCVPKSTIVSESIQTFYVTLIIALIGLALLTIVLFGISKSISNPLLNANNLLQKLVSGDISLKEKRKTIIQDEIVDISNNTNDLIDGLGSAADFAAQIGHGNLDVKYKLLSANDMLGSALIRMQDSLKEAKINEDLKKIEDEKRNWVTHGLAKFGEIIRNNNTDIDLFTSNVIKHLLEYIEAAQGAVYIHKKDEYADSDVKIFELKAAMAYGKPIMLNHTVEIGQELVGRAAEENRIIYLKNVPDNYAAISPGMKSKSRPNNVLVSPMSINNDIFGVIEILSYNEFEQHQIEFIEKLSENIASVISSVNINISTARLLEQSRHQADELAQHEEEMRQNLEEMQATQEEALKRQNKLQSHIDGIKNNIAAAEIDMQGRIISMTPSMTVQYHVSIENIKGKFYEAIVTDDETSRNQFNEFWNKMIELESGKRIQTIEHRGKSYYYLESYQVVQKDSTNPRVLITIQNKTAEKALSDELKNLKA